MVNLPPYCGSSGLGGGGGVGSGSGEGAGAGVGAGVGSAQLPRNKLTTTIIASGIK